jgi:hypothetical protein
MPEEIFVCVKASGSLFLPNIAAVRPILSAEHTRHAASKHERRVVRRILTNPEDASLMEILDRVLDRGIVVDPSSRVKLIGSDLRNLRDRLVIDWRKTQF